MSEPPGTSTPGNRSRTHSEESASSQRSSSSARRGSASTVPSFRFRRGASSRSSKDLTDELGTAAVDVSLYKEGVPRQAGREGELGEAKRLSDAARDPYEGPSHTTTEDYAAEISLQRGAGNAGDAGEEIDLEGPRSSSEENALGRDLAAGGALVGGGATLVAGGIAKPDEDGEYILSSVLFDGGSQL